MFFIMNMKNIVMIIKNAVYEGTSLGFEIESELFFGSLSYPVGKGGADSCWPGASTWTTAKCWVISCMSSKLNSVLKHDLSASQEKNKDTSQFFFHKSLSKKKWHPAYLNHMHVHTLHTQKNNTPLLCLVSITVTCYF